jgi:hypothetical protein
MESPYPYTVINASESFGYMHVNNARKLLRQGEYDIKFRHVPTEISLQSIYSIGAQRRKCVDLPERCHDWRLGKGSVS